MTKYFLVGAIVVALVGWAIQAYSRYKAFEWRTERITATIERNDEFSGPGQYLYLVQDIERDEQGWLMMKIDIPGHWKVRRIKISDGLIFPREIGHGVKLLAQIVSVSDAR